MTHVTCRLTAKNRDQFRSPTLGNRVWASLFKCTRADNVAMEMFIELVEVDELLLAVAYDEAAEK